MRIPCAALILGLFVLALPAHAQYAETPRVLATVDSQITAATQIGRRLFVAGAFRWIGLPSEGGGAVLLDATGAIVPGALPVFDGGVRDIAEDGHGGWVFVGAFRQVGGHRFTSLVHVRGDGQVDPRYRIDIDGPIRRVKIAHGRIYLLGDFTEVNGHRRLGLAAIDVASAQLSSWGSDFDPGIDPFTGRLRVLRNLAISSTGVYVSGGGQELRFPASASAGRVWGFDAGSGARLFERALFVTGIAATSRRVYLGVWRSPVVRAVEPRTGADLPWSAGFTFAPDGSQEMRVESLLLDAGRLYLGGWFRTTDGQLSLVAVDAETGQPANWRMSPLLGPGPVGSLVRVGPGLIVNGYAAYDVQTGVLLPWRPQVGGVVAAAPAGVVVGGVLRPTSGVPRAGLAAFDLQTGTLEPWTATVPTGAWLTWLDTDGAHLFGADPYGVFFKIDPVTGGVLGTVDLQTGLPAIASGPVDGRIAVVAQPVSGQTLNVITIADWSVRSMPLVVSGGAWMHTAVHAVEIAGETAYVAGRFQTANGTQRPFLVALDLNSGAVLPFDASPDAEVDAVQFAHGQLWVSGRFRRIGGVRRRGLATLDPLTGRARDWNPDAPGGASLDVGADGTIYVAASSSISGRSRGRLAAFAPASGTWTPWRPALGDLRFFVPEVGDSSLTVVNGPLRRRAAFLPDCVVPTDGWIVACYTRTSSPPSVQTVSQAGSNVSLSWNLPPTPPIWTSVQVDVGRREGSSDVGTFTLPADATALGGPVLAGSYFARVRTVGPDGVSPPTTDVSVAVGPPDVPAAPLDPTVTTEGTRLVFRWRPPSVGSPSAYVLDADAAAGGRVASLVVGGGATSLTIDAPTGRYWGRLSALNPTGASAPSAELVIDVDATQVPCGEPPLPPADLIARIAGGSVALQWSQPDAGPVPDTQYVVAGSAPGLTNLAVIPVSGPATSFATTAPPGSYYVRVVASNACGVSPFSNEVAVVVP